MRTTTQSLEIRDEIESFMHTLCDLRERIEALNAKETTHPVIFEALDEFIESHLLLAFTDLCEVMGTIYSLSLWERFDDEDEDEDEEEGKK